MSSLFGIGGGGNVGASGSFYDYTLDQSLRANNNDAAYVYRTPSSAGSKTTFTLSAWVKRGSVTESCMIFGAGTSGSQYFFLGIDSSGRVVTEEVVSSNTWLKRSTRLLRDPSAWYHIVCTIDTNNGTADDRVRLYVNGERITSFSSNINPSSGVGTHWNGTSRHDVGGASAGNSGARWDGYLCDIYHIDGTALEPTSFAEEVNGAWVPKAYDTADGGYGTNGYHLEFANSASIGTDTSGQGNNHSVTNFAASDVVLDSPTNNFATLNVLDSHAASTYSEGNLKFADGGGDGANAHSTMVIPEISDTDTYYAEVRVNYAGYAWGISPVTLSGAAGSTTRTGMLTLYHNGNTYNGTTIDTSSYATVAVGDIFGIKAGNGKLEFFQNGTSLGDAFTGLSGTYKFGCWAVGAAGTGITWNFGQDSTFHGQETAGTTTDQNGYGLFNDAEAANNISLCAANIAEPAIGPNSDTTSDEHFDTILYTAATSNGTHTHGNLLFRPDFSWIKNRNNVEGHYLIDVVRGNSSTTNTFLQSNGTAAEGALNATGTTFSVTDTGYEFVETSITAGELYYSGRTYVGWNWKAGGTAVSNTDGSITSSVSANQDAGMSVIGWTGNGTNNATIGHGLSQTPDMVIVKNRSNAFSWLVWHKDLSGATYRIDLQGTGGQYDDGVGALQGVSSSLITLGSGNAVNQSSANMIAYAFHDVEGHLKCGSYTGNGSADGTFVYTGFRPAFVMVKRTDSTGSWVVQDTQRDPYNQANNTLLPNSNSTELTYLGMDYLSNGFKVRNTDGGYNASNGSYIYLAFGSSFKYSNAR